MDAVSPTNAAFRRWLLFAFLLIAVWSLALTASQHFSIPAEENYRTKDLFGRFFLSFFLLASFVLLFPRPVVLGLMVFSLFFQWGTLYYCSYFGAAPEIMILWSNASEGFAVGDAVWELLPWRYLVFLGPVFALQVVLLYRHVPPKSFYHRRLVLAITCVTCYGALLGIDNISDRGLLKYGRGHTIHYTNGDRCSKFGFLPVFVRDIVLHHTRFDDLRVQALEKESQRSFGLQAEHREFSFDNIIIMQVESLDNAVLDHHVNGTPVVPFLSSLRKNSLTYRIWANHRYGSATADFEMLNGIPPLDGFFNYQVPDLPYTTSLPRFFHERGYETFCFHGVHGSFYNRRTAFTAMGFDRLVFRDEIVAAIRNGTYPLQDEFPEEKLNRRLNDKWLRDDILFRTVLREIRSPSERNRFFFIITVTSHSPYNIHDLDDKEKLIPNGTSMPDRYVNSIHAVDGWLHSFYEGLPSGTLLVIYGDHTPGFQRGETFVSDIEKRREFVPCLIHLVGENLATFQNVPRQPQDTTLSVRDVHSFLRDFTENRPHLAGTLPLVR